MTGQAAAAGGDALFLRFQEAVAGRYSLLSELGRGGMGVVYLARDVRLDRLVAIKLLPPDRAVPALRERFLREARLAARLSQPNIVPIHAVDEAGEFVYFAMGYVDGQSLADRIAQRGALGPDETARVLRDVAWALAYAHAQGVIHRDIKPDNILIERGSGRPMMADFGIAHAADRSGGTTVGTVLGTPEYMSPEQSGGDAIDARSDIYSLGVVGFFALSGRLPFTGPSASAILAQHLTQPAPPLLSMAPGAPARLAQVIDRCLAKAPIDRYASAEALAAAIESAVERPRQLPVPLERWVRSVDELRFRHVLFAPVLLWPALDMLNLLVTTLFPGALEITSSEPLYFLLVLVLPFAAYGVVRWLEVRRALKAGFTIQELRAALHAELRRCRSEDSRAGGTQAGRRLTIAIPGLVVASIGLTTVWKCYDPSESGTPTISLLFPSWIALVGGLMLTGALRRGAEAPATTDLDARSRLWDGVFGKAAAWLASLGVRRRAVSAAAPHRPTELALGDAAAALFEALPKDLRRDLAGVPDTLRRLETRARAIRARIDELTRLEAEGSLVPGRAEGAELEARREALRNDLRSQREHAEQLLADVVTALETIRIDLLRLRAGAVSTTTISLDLDAVRAVGAEIDAAAHGQAAVERLLAARPTPV